MNLVDAINSPNLSSTELLKILNKTFHVTVNWFGTRIISVESYEGSVTVDQIGQKLLAMSLQKNLSPQAINDAISCAQLINRCYQQADIIWSQSNPITYYVGYASRVIFEGYGNPYTPNPGSIKFQIADGQVSENLNRRNNL